MKRTETMGKKPDEISVSLNRYRSLIPSAALQPHLPPPLPQFMDFSCAKHASRRRSTVQNYPPPPSLRSFAPHCSTSITIPPQRWLKNSPFPNPTSLLSRLSYTLESPYRRPPRSSIFKVCISQTDGQFPLSAVFSRDWNVDEPGTRWLEMMWTG
jgi:hypothetical protein